MSNDNINNHGGWLSGHWYSPKTPVFLKNIPNHTDTIVIEIPESITKYNPRKIELQVITDITKEDDVLENPYHSQYTLPVPLIKGRMYHSEKCVLQVTLDQSIYLKLSTMNSIKPILEKPNILANTSISITRIKLH
jgi:predicted transposase YdaD